MTKDVWPDLSLQICLKWIDLDCLLTLEPDISQMTLDWSQTSLNLLDSDVSDVFTELFSNDLRLVSNLFQMTCNLTLTRLQ